MGDRGIAAHNDELTLKLDQSLKQVFKVGHGGSPRLSC
jgi:hypothetical protein